MGIEPGADPDRAPWQLVLDEVAAAGFDGIELGPIGYLPTDPERLSAELASRGLRLAAGYLMKRSTTPHRRAVSCGPLSELALFWLARSHSRLS